MKKRIIISKKIIERGLFLLLISISLNMWSQVGVGTSNPDASSALEIQSTSKGLLLPRMTGLQMNSISSPAEGLLVYCTNCTPKGLFYYNGTEWVSASTASESGTDDFTEIFSPTGKIWMDRNLGATQVATSLTDHLAYGNLYQWGRSSDGHEVINWTSSTTSDGTEQSRVTTTTSATDTPGHDDFISGVTDWRTTVNNNLWQGVNGINNPCPSGYRVPTTSEWNAERLAVGSGGAFSILKLTLPGLRINAVSGALADSGTQGSYWSSTFNNLLPDRAQRTIITSSNFSTGSTTPKGTGAAVRCIRD